MVVTNEQGVETGLPRRRCPFDHPSCTRSDIANVTEVVRGRDGDSNFHSGSDSEHGPELKQRDGCPSSPACSRHHMYTGATVFLKWRDG